MPFQAILLSITVLISILITQHEAIKQNMLPEVGVNNQPSESTSFTKDLSLNLSEKRIAFVKNVFGKADWLQKEAVDTLNAAKNFLGNQTRAIGSNFAATDQILRNNVDKFFENLAKEDSLPSAPPDSNRNNPDLNQFSSQNYEKSEAASGDILNMSSECVMKNFPSLTAKALLVKYLDYNLTISELNPEKRWPIASLSKLMTSVIALEKIGPDAKVTMSKKAVNTEGTAGDFKPGEIFRVYDLIKAMMVASSNNAAVALSEALGGQEFINEMQRKANDLKMHNTTYLEPTGLSFINQSTVNDLVKLVGYVAQNHPEIFLISKERKIEIVDLKSGEEREIMTVNQLAGESDFIGGKTGYIDEAGRNLIALFDINEQKVLFIVLGADNAFREVGELKKMVERCQ